MKFVWLALLVIPLVAILSGCVAAVVGGAGDRRASLSEDRRTVGHRHRRPGHRVQGRKPHPRSAHKDAHINVTSYNRMVLITGEVPDAAAKADVEKIVRAVENVRGIYNEVAVGPITLAVGAHQRFVHHLQGQGALRRRSASSTRSTSRS